MSAEPLKIALLGAGVVGSEVARLLTEQAELTARVGAPLELVGVGVRRTGTDRGPWITAELVTDDLHQLVTGRGADIVVEVMGGIDPARELILAAFASGASVVTANKALLAQHGPSCTKRATQLASTCTSRRASQALSPCCVRCASRWWATGYNAYSA